MQSLKLYCPDYSDGLRETKPEQVGGGALQTNNGFPPVPGGHLQNCCQNLYLNFFFQTERQIIPANWMASQN